MYMLNSKFVLWQFKDEKNRFAHRVFGRLARLHMSNYSGPGVYIPAIYIPT